MTKKYFHEVIEDDQKILDIGLKQSRLHKKERLEREKIRQANMQSDNIEMEKLSTKEKSLHEVLMEGFREEQRQRELEEEEEEEHTNCGTDDCCKEC